MKNLIAILAIASAGLIAHGEGTNTAQAPTFIRGDIDIKFNTRGNPQKGVKDVYTLNVNVCNSAIFRGTISHLPLIVDSGILSSSVIQNRSLAYDMACDVVNPQNPSQTKNVGRIFGNVPITQAGLYNYAGGSLTCSVLPMGSASGFDSKFSGTAQGKPSGQVGAPKLQSALLTIKKQVNGKTVSVAVKKYDKMVFQSHVLCAGPVQIYQEVTVNGEMVYDYDRFAWHFNNVTIQYPVSGTMKSDRLTGAIRWVESPQRKTTGEGEYQFDVRVNEPPPSESSAFSGPADESAFFTVDTSIPSLTGTMKYKDTMSGDGTTTASAVKLDLVGNNITKQQAMSLCKLLVFSSIVPINAD